MPLRRRTLPENPRCVPAQCLCQTANSSVVTIVATTVRCFMSEFPFLCTSWRAGISVISLEPVLSNSQKCPQVQACVLTSATIIIRCIQKHQTTSLWRYSCDFTSIYNLYVICIYVLLNIHTKLYTNVFNHQIYHSQQPSYKGWTGRKTACGLVKNHGCKVWQWWSKIRSHHHFIISGSTHDWYVNDYTYACGKLKYVYI